LFFKVSITLLSGEYNYPNWGVLLYILVHSTSFYNHLKFQHLGQQPQSAYAMTNTCQPQTAQTQLHAIEITKFYKWVKTGDYKTIFWGLTFNIVVHSPILRKQGQIHANHKHLKVNFIWLIIPGLQNIIPQ